MFLNKNNTNYLKKIISLLFNIEMEENFELLNAEIPSNESNIKSSYCDLILKNNNKEYIIEMNGSPYSDLTFYKNYHYLFKEHTSRNYKGNIYGKNHYTTLINIDNYNILKKDSLIYKSVLKYEQYNDILYKNIEIININLDYLRKEYYNKEKLNELEKLLIIFIEQRKDKIFSITNDKYVKELIEYMDVLKLEERFIATYDREEYEKGLQEEFENKKKEFENNKKELENSKIEFENNKKEFENNKKELENSKIEIARELKILGMPVDKIVKLTKLSTDKIMTL